MSGYSLGILETGHLPEELVQRHGTSPDMFVKFLAPVRPSIRFETFCVYEDNFPAAVTACDAWLITGARASVLDLDPWINRLQEFLADAHQGGVPMVGICFGHQVLAAALGGKVERAPGGWGIGLHEYSISKSASWLPDNTPRFAISAMHEDQVVAPPRQAEVIAGSAFCPNAVVAYETTAISFQGHPEYTASFARDLISLRRGKLFSASQADKALATLDHPSDSEHVAHWIANFLDVAISRRAAP